MFTLTLAQGLAPGKVILMGEHAVVYGTAAIAMPLSATQTRVHIFRATGTTTTLQCPFYQGPLADAPVELKGLQYIVSTVMAQCQQVTTPINIQITSTIPVARGMGSSAAVSVALIRALYRYFDYPLSQERLMMLAQSAETMTHGRASGIDTTVIGSNQAVYFKRQGPVEPMCFAMHAYLVVADTGIAGQTKEAVAHVASQSNRSDITAAIAQLGELTEISCDALTHNRVQLLGECFDHAHRLLKFIGVSHASLDAYVRVAKKAGALGAKLTGGGMGGCMIALAHNQESAHRIAAALTQHGAQHTWIQALQ